MKKMLFSTVVLVCLTAVTLACGGKANSNGSPTSTAASTPSSPSSTSTSTAVSSSPAPLQLTTRHCQAAQSALRTRPLFPRRWNRSLHVERGFWFAACRSNVVGEREHQRQSSSADRARLLSKLKIRRPRRKQPPCRLRSQSVHQLAVQRLAAHDRDIAKRHSRHFVLGHSFRDGWNRSLQVERGFWFAACRSNVVGEWQHQRQSSSAGQSTFTLQAKDSAASPQAATVSLTITVSAPAAAHVAITSASLPTATAGTAYSATLTASGGTQPYIWTLASGQLPAA